jgi:hypothetical protein
MRARNEVLPFKEVEPLNRIPAPVTNEGFMAFTRLLPLKLLTLTVVVGVLPAPPKPLVPLPLPLLVELFAFWFADFI